MKTLINRLRTEKKDVENASNIMREISKSLEDDPLLLPSYLEVVLTVTLPSFGDLFPIDNIISCVDKWIYVPSFQILSLLLSLVNNPNSKHHSVLYVSKWSKRKLLSQILYDSSKIGNQTLYNEVLSTVFSIPDKISAAIFGENQSQNVKKFPKYLKHEIYYERLITSLKHIDSEILNKCSNLGLAPLLWKTTFSSHEITKCSLNLAPSAVASFLLSLIEDSSYEMAISILSELFEKNTRVKNLVSHHFLVQKVVSERARKLLIDFLILQGLLLETLEKLGEVWSRHSLLTQMTTSLHSQISKSILQLLSKIDKESLQSCKAVGSIMSGVTTHIGISNPEIRRNGLEIGEKITSILMPEQGVKFDELHPEDRKDQNEEEIETKKSQNLSESESDVDIDGEWNENYELGQSDEDDDLIPFSINDDKVSEGFSVIHPRELIKLFRTDENDTNRYQKFQSAISSASDVIKRMTDLEFDQMGSELLSILMNIDNEYNQDDFEENRKCSFISFINRFPLKSSKQIVHILKQSREYSLGRRLQLLMAIAYAASEMSELPKPIKDDIVEGHIKRWGDPKNTKRWGSALHKIMETKSVNRFAPCATILFYGIVSSLDLQRLIREEDGLEVTQVLTTLAIILEAGGESVPELSQMANDMMDICLVLTPIKPSNARKSLVFAITISIGILGNYRGNDQIGEFLLQIAQEDPDDSIRDMAIGACSLLAQRHENDLENLFPNQ